MTCQHNFTVEVSKVLGSRQKKIKPEETSVSQGQLYKSIVDETNGLDK